jgi:parallel beta-helix repeat protein
MKKGIATLLLLIFIVGCATPQPFPYVGIVNLDGTQYSYEGNIDRVEVLTTPLPIYTATRTFTPTITFTPSFTPTITATFTPSFTPTATSTSTPATPPPTSSFYVDNTCANNGNGRAQTCASTVGGVGVFNSLSAAQAGVTGNQAGTALMFRAGQTFAGQFTVGASGASGNPFVITSYGTGAKPIISGGTRNMYIGSGQYITVDGLDFSSPTGTVNIYVISPARYIVIKNSSVHGASATGIYTWKVQDITINNNDIYNSDSEGINVRMGDTTLALPGIMIYNNTIRNNLRYGILTNGLQSNQVNMSGSKFYNNEIYNNATAIYLVFSSYIEIYNNYMHDNGKDCQTTNDCIGEDYGFAVQSGSYNSFHDNLILRAASTGIGVYGEQSYPGNDADGNLIYRNIVAETLMGNAPTIWQRDINWQCWAGNSVGKNNKIFNNIFFGSSSAGMNFLIGDTNPAYSGNVAYNNVFYGAGTGLYFEGTSTNAGWSFKNNIFAGNANYAIYASSRSGGLELSNNIYYKATGGTLVTYNSTSYTASTIGNLDSSARTTNPLFVNTTSWSGLRLMAASPARDTGLNLGVFYEMTFDPNYTTWPIPAISQNNYGTGWEIGAYIYRP